MDQTLDLDPLDTEPKRDDVRAYRDSSRSAGVPAYDSVPMSFRSVATTALMVVFTPGIAVSGVWGLFSEEFNAGRVIWSIFSLLIAAGGVILLARVRFPRRGSRLWSERLRTSRFAEQNGADYEASSAQVDESGLIFNHGTDRRVSDRVRFQREPKFEAGNLHYRVLLPKGATMDFHWGYLAVPLERRFPHTVLDSRSNNGLRGITLPATLANRGAIELEGDFSEFFELTVPAGYERDALYLLTPDLMAILIDEGADLDVEIVDDTLYVYRTTPFDLASSDEWRRIRRIVDTIGDRTQTRTSRYRDERTGDRSLDQVAPQGRRIGPGSLSLPAKIALGATLVGIVAAFITGVLT
ncbi:hypothetical protein EYE40_06230 [Glaciihabitans arcticus]|uniref:DUF3137 domain-containing protein n=1 Tax=Glaciihabitans arcticus TaxID=2668039 RepID=A0A4V2JEV4_9MICO|nr:hypothetical protein [Glaciihabitans arcticus]TBN57029.1 hypothetical protein EYE40_06230 [Glaciihabitans arcticus]